MSQVPPHHPYAPPNAFGPMAPYGHAYGYGHAMSPPQARAMGSILDYPTIGCALPAICCKCGTSHGLRPRMQTMTWVNPLAYLGLLGGLLPMLVLVMVLQKRAQVVLPICEACDRRWSRATLLRGLSVLAPFLIAPALGAFVSLFTRGDTPVVVGVLSFFALIVILPITAVKLVFEPRAVVATRMDDHRAALKGVHPELLRALGG